MVDGRYGECDYKASCMKKSVSSERLVPKESNDPKASCMKNGVCRKYLPKEFKYLNIENLDEYPIVYYNTLFIFKYNVCINDETSLNMNIVKYLFIYVFKGYDDES